MVNPFGKEILGITDGERGQGLVSYAVILMLITLACVGGLTMFGNSVVELFNQIRSGIP